MTGSRQAQAVIVAWCEHVESRAGDRLTGMAEKGLPF